MFIICVKKRRGSVDCNLLILKTKFFLFYEKRIIYIYIYILYCIVLLSIEITNYNLNTQQHNLFYNISTKIKELNL